jgi:hypothetical protein
MALFALPFVLVSLVLSSCSYRRVSALRAIADHQPRQGVDGPDGRVALAGTLHAETHEALPSGKQAGLWAYAVIRGTGKSSSTACTRLGVVPFQRVSLIPEGSTSGLALDRLFQGSVAWAGIGSFHNMGAALRIDSGEPTESAGVPASLPAGCKMGVGSASYRQALITDAQRVTVLACLRAGEIVPCGDGSDAITTLGVEALARRATRSEPGVGFVIAWNCICGLVLSLLCLASLPTLPRTTHRCSGDGAA